MIDPSRIPNYLTQCQVPSCRLGESASETTTPPSDAEVRELITYLRQHRVNPVIVGSVGIFHHLTLAAHKFRPTVDLDIFTHAKLPPPPQGWRVDTASLGVTSWISPSGGLVDFLEPGHEFPNGNKNPSKVAIDPKAPKDYPVAAVVELLKLKLNSYRAKDMTDAVELAKATGGVPPDSAFGRLNPAQKENLAMLRSWVDHFKSE